MSEQIEKYLKLRSYIDLKSENLLKQHGGNIVCKKGCFSCCDNLTLFPVEFEAIKAEMKRDGFSPAKLKFDESLNCGFLKDELCSIYRYRPIICRTHGLPIVFFNDEYDEWSVSFCELNFTKANLEELSFSEENTLNIDDLNSKLYSINKEFTNSRRRIPMKLLIEA
jgi:uncharacterized protein